MTSPSPIQTLDAAAAESQWQHYDVLIKRLRRTINKLPRTVAGCQQKFTEVILQSCKQTPENDRTLESIKTRAILETVRECGGNQTRAAVILECQRGTVAKYVREVAV